MASNYTCRACSRALLRSLRPKSQTSALRALPTSYRTIATAVSSPKFASKQGPKKDRTAKERIVVKPDQTSLQGLAGKIRKNAPVLTETYVAYGATEELIKECARHGDYQVPQAMEKNGEIPTIGDGVHLGVGKGWWYENLGLQPTFSNWTQITFIHMYMLQVRFRMFPPTHSGTWIQHLTNHLFYAAEDRLVVWHKLNANSVRQKYMKDMFAQWRAVLLSYDEGLVKGDATLAAALWRNLLGARHDVDFQKLAQIVGYMRRQIQRLDYVSDDEVARGQWKFTIGPESEADTVARLSRSITDDKRR